MKNKNKKDKVSIFGKPNSVIIPVTYTVKGKTERRLLTMSKSLYEKVMMEVSI